MSQSSNILIGLLSHLKRRPFTANGSFRSKQSPANSNTSTLSVSTRADPSLAFAAVKSSSSRPLPVVPASSSTSRKAPRAEVQTEDHPIPLPSFATLSRSLPTKSLLASYKPTRDPGHSSEEVDSHNIKTQTNRLPAQIIVQQSGRKKGLKHLWHAALTLILERGRPVTRKFISTSAYLLLMLLLRTGCCGVKPPIPANGYS